MRLYEIRGTPKEVDRIVAVLWAQGYAISREEADRAWVRFSLEHWSSQWWPLDFQHGLDGNRRDFTDAEIFSAMREYA